MFTILSDGYPVHIGENALQKLKDYLEHNKYSQYFILVDENTLQFCLSDVIQNVEVLKDAEVIETESGEENKVIEVVTQVWLAMSDLHADRKALVINLGGGVLGDMGGFIASTYKRGVDFINIPTTLLSMVDSSVGGKLGIDLGGLKNQIGVFNFPKGVFISPQFLSTLEPRQLKSGFAEVIKHGLIADHLHLRDALCYLDNGLPGIDVLIPQSIKNLSISTMKKIGIVLTVVLWGLEVTHAQNGEQLKQA